MVVVPTNGKSQLLPVCRKDVDVEIGVLEIQDCHPVVLLQKRLDIGKETIQNFLYAMNAFRPQRFKISLRPSSFLITVKKWE